MYHREIAYDYEKHDYAMYLDGELVGFARSYREAEEILDKLILELMGCKEGDNEDLKLPKEEARDVSQRSNAP